MVSPDPSTSAGLRRCNPCTECCVHLPVPAGFLGPGSKPAGVACRHMGPKGCRIYGRRSSVCRGFRCAWLADESWPEVWRPDTAGLLCLRELIGGELPAAAVYEIHSGALGSAVATDMVEQLRQTTAGVVLVDRQGGRQQLLGYLAVNEQPAASGVHDLQPIAS